MQQFTRSEVTWIISALKEVAERYQFESSDISDKVLASFLYLRSGQLFGIANRFQDVLDNNDHRIKVL